MFTNSKSLLVLALAALTTLSIEGVSATPSSRGSAIRLRARSLGLNDGPSLYVDTPNASFHRSSYLTRRTVAKIPKMPSHHHSASQAEHAHHNNMHHEIQTMKTHEPGSSHFYAAKSRFYSSIMLQRTGGGMRMEIRRPIILMRRSRLRRRTRESSIMIGRMFRRAKIADRFLE